MEKTQLDQLLQGFSKLTRQQRYSRLVELGALTEEDVTFLNSGSHIPTNLAEKFIENVLGYMPMPLGVAVNFRINDQNKIIPMAVEETSIIAALCKMAKWIRANGSITTLTKGNTSIGQIQFAKVQDVAACQTIIAEHKADLIADANEQVAMNLVKRGGGVKDIVTRELTRPDGDTMLVLHVHIDTCDAMGANLIIQICEYLKPQLELLTGEKVTMCILSNLNDSKLACAKVTINNVDDVLGRGIEEASIFAELDPYRAATSNKGALNGMDPIVLATGNDWRAVESGVHAYAAKDGQYRSITQWRYQNGVLTGLLEAPIMVGIVGGMTKLHPAAKMCLNMLDVSSANELAEIIAAVGLVQNLGAIRALCTFGFIEGHMKLHIDNLTLSAGASDEEIPILRQRLEETLKLSNRITVSIAKEILQEIRDRGLADSSTSVAEMS